MMLLIIFLSLLIETIAELNRAITPHGLLVVDLDASHPSKSIHQAVLKEKSNAACQARLQHLRELISNNDIARAIEVALALKNRQNLPDSCKHDKIVTGIGTIYTVVATPSNKINGTVIRNSKIRFKNDERVLPCVSATGKLLYKKNEAIAGFELDNQFVKAETSIICNYESNNESRLVCEAASRTLHNLTLAQALLYADRLQGVRPTPQGHSVRRKDEADIDDFLESAGLAYDTPLNHATGTKKIIYIPVCQKEYGFGCNTGTGFNYGLTSSTHGSNLTLYLQKLHEVSNEFFLSNSYGQLQLAATILEPLQLDYAYASCDTLTPLDYWGSRSSSALDFMTYAKVKEVHGIDVVKDFDFNVIVNRYCPGFSWSGIGWIGFPGLALNLRAFDYDASMIHELGHNLGAEHASLMSGGAKGAKAYIDSLDTWSEYGNAHSTMGRGNHEANGVYYRGYAEFMASSKIIFDWLSGSGEIASVTPYSYSSGEAFCSPCGPITLQATDAGTIQFLGIPVAVEIKCEANNRYFFLEYREVTPSSPGVLVSWTTVSYSTRVAENSVLVDATPDTSSFTDAMIIPGADFTVYCGTSGTNYPVNIAVASSNNFGAVVVTINSAETSAILPEASPKPTPDYGECLYGIVLGKGATVEDATYVDPTDSTVAGIRCCNDNGRGGSICPDGNQATYDLQRAIDECTAIGMRLCTIQEVVDNYSSTVQTGCWYDGANIWTSDFKNCSPSLSPTTTLTCFAVAEGRPTKDSLSLVEYVNPNNTEAGIRCCNDNVGERGASFCPGPDGIMNVPGSKYDYQTAYNTCEENIMRLCTISELFKDVSSIWNTGCDYNTMKVWTSDSTSSCDY
uniref:Peptidase M11 gametolysin domain-containing protein n=1 Tax=Aureoumbra lagunensis TaxID=44058 RepID=A0A7S3JYX6_9STRA|mmetsp:Transcript_14717/g.19563  ORF Transcript_14717/g.19563 Transcript_14717/m.19563 type:complete len:852 (+) Transcript_14717:1690-4245(+)